jgi:cytochrome oxidase Cu insertion factor (SCO1/SenC/PrrC family)
MRTLPLLVLAPLIAATLPGQAPAQPQKKKSDEEFVKEKPAVGDKLPALTVYTPDGKEVKTSDLRGRYVVLTFGCLT